MTVSEREALLMVKIRVQGMKGAVDGSVPALCLLSRSAASLV